MSYDDYEIEIIEPTEQARQQYGYMHGTDTIELSIEHITALGHGKMLAWNNGEYVTFVKMSE